jgi:Domain of unknown function (DUF4331)
MSHHYSGPNYGSPHGDARLDITDLYAFPKPGSTDKSILIMNVHPSRGLNPPGATTPEPFALSAMYELKIDTDGDAVADIAYRVRFSALATSAFSPGGAAIRSFSTRKAPSTTCSSQAAISLPKRTCAVWSSRCRILLSG